jgi:hypothetical protein
MNKDEIFCKIWYWRLKYRQRRTWIFNKWWRYKDRKFICKTGNGWQNTLLTDKTDTDWRGWHWLTGLTLAVENNFWLRKLILLIEKFFYEVINLNFNLLFISTLLCYSFCNHRKQRRRKQRRRKQRRRKQRRRKQHCRNIVVNNVIATSS